MKTSALCVGALLTALSLAGCSGGDDVYVRDDDGTTQSSASLECAIAPGDDVCSRTFASVPPAEHARVVATLQAIYDFAWIADAALAEIEGACQAIVAETSHQMPYLDPNATRETRLGITCQAASDAIMAGGPSALQIDVFPAVCTASTPRACAESPVACDVSQVTVVAAPNASPTAVTLGTTLSRHLGAVASLKSRLEGLAKLTGQIAGSSDAIALLPGRCVVSTTAIAVQSSSRVSAVAKAASLVTAAASPTSH